MRLYHFTEMPYPYVPPSIEKEHRGLKGFLPNDAYDPRRGYELMQRYLDEYELADHVGLDVMVNEHHHSAATLQAAVPVTAALVAARTSRARVLLLGSPLPQRDDPVRIAEELAVLDTATGGRIDCGLVRGTQVEAWASNQNPSQNFERFVEAHDLVLEAWTNRDVFNWEGRHFHRRYVSIWPRPFQDPHPPIWISATSPALVSFTARHGYTLSVLLGTYGDTARVFARYREETLAAGHPEPGPDRFAYMALCHVAPTNAQALERGRELMWYLKNGRPRLGALIPPGFSDPVTSAMAFRGTLGAVRRLSFEELIAEGIALVGSPDTVVRRIRELHDKTGVGHLILMNHAGGMQSNTVREHLLLLAAEVLPAVRSLGTVGVPDSVRLATPGIDPVVVSALS